MFTYTGADTLESAATKLETDPDKCSKELNPGAPSATDLCDTNPSVAMFAVMQKVNGTYTKIGDNLAAVHHVGIDLTFPDRAPHHVS